MSGIPRSAHRRRRGIAVSTGVLLLALGAPAVLRWQPSGPPAPAPPPVARHDAGSPDPARPVPQAPQPAGPRVPPSSVPVALRIPAIGVAVSVSRLGLNADGTVQVPTDYALPGWFELGPAPGQSGSAVVLGHVDSHRGPAVFFRLRLLKPGHRVEVTSADGTVSTFVVRAVQTYPKKQFPARLVYGSHGYSALQLVTCGGRLDPRTRSYLSNVVAYTALDGTVPARRASGGR